MGTLNDKRLESQRNFGSMKTKGRKQDNKNRQTFYRKRTQKGETLRSFV
jgi:hypothetical protein